MAQSGWRWGSWSMRRCCRFERKQERFRPSERLAVAPSTYPVQKLVVHPRKWKKPGIAVVQPQRRTWKWNPYERIVRLPTCNQLSHLLTLPRGHCHAMTRVSERVVDSVDLACVRHDVKGEVERSAPNKFDFCIPKLRIHLDHPASQKLGAPADRILALRKEGRSPTKQHSVIRCEPIVVKVVFRIINLAI